MGYKIGDEVTWSSQAAGTTKRKTGEIVAVISAAENCELEHMRLVGVYDARSTVDSTHGRKHVNYLVLVPGKNKRCRPLLYRPLATLLKKCTARK